MARLKYQLKYRNGAGETSDKIMKTRGTKGTSNPTASCVPRVVVSYQGLAWLFMILLCAEKRGANRSRHDRPILAARAAACPTL